MGGQEGVKQYEEQQLRLHLDLQGLQQTSQLHP